MRYFTNACFPRSRVVVCDRGSGWVATANSHRASGIRLRYLVLVPPGSRREVRVRVVLHELLVLLQLAELRGHPFALTLVIVCLLACRSRRVAHAALHRTVTAK